MPKEKVVKEKKPRTEAEIQAAKEKMQKCREAKSDKRAAAPPGEKKPAKLKVKKQEADDFVEKIRSILGAQDIL